MYLNCKQGLRCIVKCGIALAIISATVVGNNMAVGPGPKDPVVFAANQSESNSNGEYIMSASSFESDPDNDTSNTTDIAPLIATSACMSSDFTDTSACNDNTTDTIDTADTIVKTDSNQDEIPMYDGSTLDAYHGTHKGPSGKETYYNLPMDGVVRIMRKMGYSKEEYPYWVREDGVKMFGDYIMVAANLDIRPKGTILECSLGTAMVVDTGDFAEIDHTQLDIATSW